MSQQSSLQIINTPQAAPAPTPVIIKPVQGNRRANKVLAGASNLANLLPTGTVLAFQTLMPSFTDGGSCLVTHKYLTEGLIILCAAACFFSSFTDSFLDQNGRIYYGIAVPKGFYLFNCDNHDEDTKDRLRTYLRSYRLKKMDFIRALVSLMMFLMFALGDANVQDCFWPKADPNMKALFMNLPLAAALFSTFFFSIFPTSRRGIGYADSPRDGPNFDDHVPVLPVANPNPNNK
ncbi:hypothetical protein HAX54_013656 [Datura stramonium]|uniref:Uncharacterized protein n=1 Tax=Datura stramonium TaxID=4076 RepID=A0ABS8TLJ5_DATST|nr:hypothetical protein [Datura stramonium]